jgi:hypothetical protein
MAKPDTTTNGILETMKSAGSALAANPMFGPQTMHFWQAQDRMLDEAQKLSSAWFKRRHAATQSALDASSKVVTDGVHDPSIAIKTLAEWQAHSMERLAEDARDGVEFVARCAGLVVSNEVEAMEEATELAQKATKTSKSEPV